ncbi:MAG: S49 family peptidase [Vicinamibacterales bacterium]
MINTALLDRLLAGRGELALDRAALPGLAAMAAVKLGPDGRPLAAFGEGTPGRVQVQRVGDVAIVPLTGYISTDPFMTWLFGGTSPDAFLRAIRESVEDATIAHVLILADSPGGEVRLVPEAATEIRRLRSQKPITALARPLAASAAYWLAAQAGTLIVTPSGDVGSVGVYAMHAEQSRRLDEIGITVTLISSTPEKVELSDVAPLSDDARAFVKGRIDERYREFLEALAAGRRVSVDTARKSYGSGRVYGAAEALRRGLVDRIATVEEVLSDFASGRPSGRRGARSAQAFDQAAADEAAIIAALTSEV